jgi:ABC-2 type transport system ATP-binding protein
MRGKEMTAMKPVCEALMLDGITVAVPARGGSFRALDGVNLSVEEGSVVGFLGPNGAGKTTAIHALLGFIEPTAGCARIFGRDARQSIARERIGYLPEHPSLYPFLTGRELLHAAGRLFGLRGAALKRRARDLLERLSLAGAADRRIGVYSRGMMQRLGLAQALINDPDLVILDEPTGGLDPLGRMEVRDLIAELRDRGKTVFFSSHELSEVEKVCDRAALLVDGRIVARGTVEEFTRDGRGLERFFLDTVRAARAGKEAAS